MASFKAWTVYLQRTSELCSHLVQHHRISTGFPQVQRRRCVAPSQRALFLPSFLPSFNYLCWAMSLFVTSELTTIVSSFCKYKFRCSRQFPLHSRSPVAQKPWVKYISLPLITWIQIHSSRSLPPIYLNTSTPAFTSLKDKRSTIKSSPSARQHSREALFGVPFAQEKTPVTSVTVVTAQIRKHRLMVTCPLRTTVILYVT